MDNLQEALDQYMLLHKIGDRELAFNQVRDIVDIARNLNVANGIVRDKVSLLTPKEKIEKRNQLLNHILPGMLRQPTYSQIAFDDAQREAACLNKEINAWRHALSEDNIN